MIFTKLNSKQKEELGKTFLDTGKVIFLGTGASFFLPSLAQKEVSVGTLITGIIFALTFIILGVMFLLKGENNDR